MPIAIPTGKVKFGWITVQGWSGLIKDVGALSLPTAMTMEQVATACDQPGGFKEVLDKQFRTKGATLLAMTDIGSPAIASSKKDLAPEDVKGLRMRAPAEMHAELIKLLGGSPVAIPFAEVYTALQHGTIESAIIGFQGIQSQRVYEVTKFAIIPGSFTGTGMQGFAANLQWWNGFSAADRETIGKAIREAELACRAEIIKDRAGLADLYRQKGMEVTLARSRCRSSRNGPRRRRPCSPRVDSFSKEMMAPISRRERREVSIEAEEAPEVREQGFFFKLVGGISRWGAYLGGMTLIVITAIVTYDVFARFLGHPTDWATEVAGLHGDRCRRSGRGRDPAPQRALRHASGDRRSAAACAPTRRAGGLVPGNGAGHRIVLGSAGAGRQFTAVRAALVDNPLAPRSPCRSSCCCWASSCCCWRWWRGSWRWSIASGRSRDDRARRLLFFFALVIAGTPIFGAMGIAALTGVWLLDESTSPLLNLGLTVYQSLGNFLLIAVPLYIYAGDAHGGGRPQRKAVQVRPSLGRRGAGRTGRCDRGGVRHLRRHLRLIGSDRRDDRPGCLPSPGARRLHAAFQRLADRRRWHARHPEFRPASP